MQLCRDQVAFTYTAHGEPFFDYMSFDVNDATVHHTQTWWSTGNFISGVVVVLPPGEHKLTWSWVKDWSLSGGEDKATLHEILITGTPDDATCTDCEVPRHVLRVVFRAALCWVLAGTDAELRGASLGSVETEGWRGVWCARAARSRRIKAAPSACPAATAPRCVSPPSRELSRLVGLRIGKSVGAAL